MREADVVVIGAGAAGLTLAWRLTRSASAGPGDPTVLLVEPPPGPVRTPARTWCFWEEPGGDWDELLTASWQRLLIRGRDGRSTTADCPTPYKMLRSEDFTRALGERLRTAPNVERVTGTVTAVHDTPHGARVTGLDAQGRPFRLRGRWVFDSRPPRRLPPARTTLLQHFRGWFVRTGDDCFDPSVAELMDLRTPQPRRGLSFAYVLPVSAREALVEYTEFSGTVLGRAGYEAALRHYTSVTRPLGPFTVTATEQGVIPMTDGDFPRRTGESVFPLGAAAGATRPSTGYTFTALQRQTAAVAEAVRAGRTPVPPRPHLRRHRAMDAVLLRALATGGVDGGEFFEGLFRGNPLPRVLHFLDGRSSLREEWQLGLRTPVGAMLRSLVSLPAVPRRVGAPPPAESAAHTAPRPEPAGEAKR